MKKRFIKGAAALFCALTLTAAPLQETLREGMIQEISASAASDDADENDIIAPGVRSFDVTGLTNSFITDNMFYSVLNEKRKLAIWHGVGNTSMKTPVIPQTVVNPKNGVTYTVAAIGDPEDRPNQNLCCRNKVTKLTIPKTVKYIYDHAFLGGKVKTVVDKSGSQLWRIGESAFEDCENLVSVDLEHSGSLSRIGKSAFVSCDKLTKVTLSPQANMVLFGDSSMTHSNTDSVFSARPDGKYIHLCFLNNTAVTREFYFFTADINLFVQGKLKIHSGKCRIYEDYEVLRGENTTNSKKWIQPI